MTDYFLSADDGCCLNCPKEEHKLICGGKIWCDRCLCLKGCEYYGRDLGDKRGYCGIRKELLNKLEADYIRNPQSFLNYLNSIKSQGIKVPRVLWEIVERKQQASLWKTDSE